MGHRTRSASWQPGERAKRVRDTEWMAKDRVLPPEEWAEWPDDKLLDLRMCQLGLTIEGSVLAERIDALQRELDARGLDAFKPHFWLSDEWFSPDAVPGVAVPFYLAHPRL